MVSMSLRWVFALGLVPVVAATAQAQAPGADYGGGGGDYYAGPSATPVIQPTTLVAPAQPAFTPRWSVAVAAGTMSLHPQSSPDATSTEFSIGELAVRYRGWRHLELELAFAGGTQQLPDGSDGTLKIAHVTAAARYRFNIEQHLNWWLLAGLGGTTVAPQDAPNDQVKAAQRGHALLGIGLEYRWQHFALQGEARAIATGPTDAEQMTADATGTDAPGLSGGAVTVGGAYYF